ncbi:MAG TPA: hypothetical protein ENK63_01130 [Rhodobacterales bacterium]|nr:hypothetical protein [Rhodobacterales bacterium]
MLFDVNIAADALDDLLDNERGMILEGRIDGLADTTRQKERLIARLGEHPSVPRLLQLREKIQRNQSLLSAAARGLKAARARLDHLSGTGAPMRAYSANGAAFDLVTPGKKPGINHRA